MRRTLVLVAALLGLLVSSGPAAASEPVVPVVGQLAGQVAGSGQTAGATAGATQVSPSNTNIAVRVLSPGDAGSVTQSNTVVAGALAANGNSTDQSTTQAGGGIQAAGQAAANEQAATADSTATQEGASNENIDVRVLSPGDGGSVTQSNTVVAGALAANGNTTDQSASQTGGAGSQVAGQLATNDQTADADSTATQEGASNENVDVRVLSPGDGGSVEQSNTVASLAGALNGNSTGQDVSQSQTGGGGSQISGQAAPSTQSASANSNAAQTGASNENVDVRVLSPGDGGTVQQSNTVASLAGALNGNSTGQDVSQSQTGGGGSQIAGQAASNAQDAVAGSTASQEGASNSNTPARVGSEGDDGSVTQSNGVLAAALALNENCTDQVTSQGQGGPGAPGRQIAGQIAANDQKAQGTADASQVGASNANTPARVLSPGGGGSVTQANLAGAVAIAANGNVTGQQTTQSQGGWGGPAVQAAGQLAANLQGAGASATTVQQGASNVNAPIRIASPGGDDDVVQLNAAGSLAAALNGNATSQGIGQSQAGGGGIAVQAAGQAALNTQTAGALAETLQACVSNENVPIGVLGPSGGGSVRQANLAAAIAAALNLNATKQDASQAQAGGGAAPAVQAAGADARNAQTADGRSLVGQGGACKRPTCRKPVIEPPACAKPPVCGKPEVDTTRRWIRE